MSLNENELRVLKACFENAQDAAGGDFGFTDELHGYLLDMGDRQIGGYITDLQRKGMIYVDAYQTDESEGFQITFPREALEAAIAAGIINEKYAEDFDVWHR